MKRRMDNKEQRAEGRLVCLVTLKADSRFDNRSITPLVTPRSGAPGRQVHRPTITCRDYSCTINGSL